MNTFVVEVFEHFRLGNAVFCRVRHIKTARTLGVEADDFVFAVFLVFKNRRNQACVEFFGVDGFEIFCEARLIKTSLPARFSVWSSRSVILSPPKFVEVFAARVGKGCAHFQAWWGCIVERAQYAV